MPAEPRLLDLDNLSRELRRILYELVPRHLQPALTAITTPTARTQAAIHAHLIHLVSALRAAVPQWLLNSIEHESTAFETTDATLLFADITDFTPLTERLAMLSERGNEELVRILNRFFSEMIAIAAAWGGDVLAFGGDAVLVAFRGPDHAATAVTAAAAMRAEMAAFAQVNIHGMRGDVRLAMKIGLASGPLVLTHAGTNTRCLALALGSVARDTNAMAEGLAGGQIHLDQRVAAAVSDRANLSFQEDGTAFLEEILRHASLPSTHIPQPNLSLLSISALARQAVALAPYLPREIVHTLAGQPRSTPGIGEQRHVVSVFAHLTGLQALADMLSAEHMAIVMNMVLSRIVQTIEENRGVLARIDNYADGHKLLALFGAPHAYENIAYSAVHTALMLQRLVQQANTDVHAAIHGERQRAVGAQPSGADTLPSLAILIGIGNGQVVSGLVGSPTRYEYTVIGESVNIAARLMTHAGPVLGDMLLLDSARQLIGSLVDATEHTIHPKGMENPVTVWSVCALGLQPPRRINLATELRGRENEMRMLNDAVAAFRRSSRRIVFLEGEAGTGKSRLRLELWRQIKDVAWCINVHPPFQNAPSYALFEQLLRKIYRHFAPVYKTPQEWLTAVEQHCPEKLVELTTALGFLLRLPGFEYYRLGPNAETQQQILAHAVQALLQMVTLARPLAIFLEDLHRADERSLRLFEAILHLPWTTWQGPLLLCVTSRSQRGANDQDIIPALYEATLASFAYGCQLIQLKALSQAASAALLDDLLINLAPETRTAILEHSGRNPLFLELLAVAIDQMGVLCDGPHGRTLRIPLGALQLPHELSELVVAQIDSLSPEARALACAAAVIATMNKSFPQWLVAKITGGGHAFAHRWKELTDAAVVVAEPPDQQMVYTFRHPLFQEKAYTLLQTYERWSLHQQVAIELEAIREPVEQERHMDALAFHAYEGQDWERALKYSLAVGQRARWAYDVTRARLYLRRAMYLARALKLPEREAVAREGLGMLYTLMGRFNLARAHLQSALRQGARGGAYPEAQARRHRLLAVVYERTAKADDDYAQAEQLCLKGLTQAAGLAPPNVEVVRLHTQLAEVLWRCGQYDKAEYACHAGLAALPPEPQWPRERGALQQRLATIDGQRGNYQPAIKILEETRTLIEPTGDKVLLAAILNNLGLYMGRIGKYTEAFAYHQESLRLKEEVHDLVGKVTSLINIGDLCQIAGDYDVAMTWLLQAQQLCERHDLQEPLARTLTVLGIVRYVQGHLEPAKAALLQQARADFERTLAIFEELEDEYGQADSLYRLGDIALAQHDSVTATIYAERALALARRLKSPAYESCALRVIGEALLQRGAIEAVAGRLQAAWQLQKQVADPYDQTLLLAAVARLEIARANYEQALIYAAGGLALARKHRLCYQIALLNQLHQLIEHLRELRDDLDKK